MQPFRFSLPRAAALSLLLAACGDDGSSTPADTTAADGGSSTMDDGSDSESSRDPDAGSAANDDDASAPADAESDSDSDAGSSPAPGGGEKQDFGEVVVTSSAIGDTPRTVQNNRLPELEPQDSQKGPARKLTITQARDPLAAISPFDSVSVTLVEATGEVLSAAVVLATDPTAPLAGVNYYGTCAPCTGIRADLEARTLTFDDAPLTATALSGSAAQATVRGTLGIPDYTARAGTSVTGTALAACVATASPSTSARDVMECVAGSYVGTGIDGGACTLTVDASTGRWQFDDGTRTSAFDFDDARGVSNLQSLMSAGTATLMLSNPDNPLEVIELQYGPFAARKDRMSVRMRAYQPEGGSLRSVYDRACLLELPIE